MIVLVCITLMAASSADSATNPGSIGHAAFPGAPAPVGEVLYGDWNGDGTIKVGIFSNGNWYLDYPGTGVWVGCGTTATTDRCYEGTFGAAGDIPVVGDWNGDGRTKIGIFRNGNWYLDYPGTGVWVGCGTTATTDRCYEGTFGAAGDIPVVGDWTGDGITKIGVYRDSAKAWYLDMNGDGIWDNADRGVAGSFTFNSLYAQRGAQGVKGDTGAAGPAGAQGIQGLTGLTGPAGADGAVGAAGPAGAQGIQGLTGLTGPAGADGAVGAAGPAGAQGDTGDTGAPGLVWKGTWDVAATYLTGQAVVYNSASYISLADANIANVPDAAASLFWQMLAAQGVKGDTGAAGPAGAQGIQGLTGLTGPAGADGAVGAAGPAGAQGIQGLTGLTGPAGADGAVGAAGPAGAQGDTGDTGAPGLVWKGTWDVAATYITGQAVVYNSASYISLADANIANVPDAAASLFWQMLTAQGVKGDTGAAGPAGAQGIQGLTGLTGPAGADGAVGAAGPAGAQGIQGLTGLTGPAGADGAVGAAGPAGAQGDTGDTGAPGLVWKGTWDVATTYITGQAVVYNSASYISLADANIANVPDAAASLFWQMLAAQGVKGDTGAAGPAGAQGIQGLTGLTGPAGADGAVGAAGPAGAQGIQGLTGLTGPAGADGAVGAAGPAGAQGDTGDTGAPGLVWKGTWDVATTYITGQAVVYNSASYISLADANIANVPDAAASLFWQMLAAQGVKGDTGAAGPAGAQGIQGLTGLTGPAGADGAVGAAGPAGAQGIQGLTGLTGPAGADGAVGAAGPAGAQGDTGDTGAPGLVWKGTWDVAATYLTGQAVVYNSASYISLADANIANVPDAAASLFWQMLAAQGVKGDTGAAGPAGAQGIQGLTGLTGPAGADGAVGAAGPAGAQGIQGLTGLTGPAGADGAVGAAGPAGAQGDTGDTGAPGLVWKGTWDVATTYITGQAVVYNSASYISLADANIANVPDAAASLFWQMLAAQGVKGDTGAAGPAGAQGIQGLTGLTGPAGADGAVGAAGPAGAQGIQGLTGLTGPAGADGAVGAAGPAGAQGDTGDTGAPGLVWKGTWDVATTYITGQAVVYNSASYISLADANIANVPDAAASLFWQMLAAQGVKGDTGAAGPAGAQGIQGLTGLTGPAGADGAVGAAGPAGAQGIQGLTGLTGPAGADGAVGAAGPAGAQGDTGDTGAPGLVWKGTWDVAATYITGQAVVYNSASYISLADANIANVPDAAASLFWQMLAAQGVKGDTGAAGPAGAQGIQGLTGLTGPAGADGAVGAAGPAGAQGDTGDTGLQGIPGVSNIVTLTENVNMPADTADIGRVFKKAVGITITGVSCIALGAGAVIDVDVQKCDANFVTCNTILSAPIHCSNAHNTGTVAFGTITSSQYVSIVTSGRSNLVLLDVNMDYQ